MKVYLIAISCFLATVFCQTQHKNGNPTGEIGQPSFDEIVVESTLTVRGKSGTRSGKSLITNSRLPEKVFTAMTVTPEIISDSSSNSRNRRASLQSPDLRLKTLALTGFKNHLIKALHKPTYYQTVKK